VPRASLSCFIAVLMVFLRSPAAAAVPDNTAEANPLSLLKSGNYAALETYYAGRQRRYESGVISDETLYGDFRALYEDSAANEPYFSAWVRSFPKSYSARTARGAYYYRMAWFVRGDKFVSETPAHQLKQMAQYLAKANPDLMASLEMTDKPYLTTLYLLNASMLSGSHSARRHWLDKGNALDPANVLLRLRYMFSLRPRWGGSHTEMREFLGECERQHLPGRTLAKLDLMIQRDIADEGSKTQSPADRYALWGEVLRIEKLAGEPPSVEAVMRHTRAAWDLRRREETDRGLEQLARMHVDEAWALSQIGWIYAQQHRDAEAWPFLLKAAELSDAWAQFTVGKTTYLGCPDINLLADRSAGLAWIKRSADQHFAEAEGFLSSATK
jgi:tetratricopeptide (TPR) repeat protein